MATKISIVALVLAIAALGVAVFDRPPEPTLPDASNAEVAALARRVDELSARLSETRDPVAGAGPGIRAAPRDPAMAPTPADPIAASGGEGEGERDVSTTRRVRYEAGRE